MRDALDEARDLVLADNTAQAVFKHLSRIEDDRKTLGLRWIWELLQNARDSARSDGVRVRVRLSESKLRFEHDGKPFDEKEIAHLVYHGSTKVERLDNIGQFGSGFLSTHLLSRVVSVDGCLTGSGRFAFSLDRTGDTVDALREAMERSWRQFKKSASDDTLASDADTSFEYALTDLGRKLAHDGLLDLHRYGTLMLAFCPTIACLSVETPEEVWSLARLGRIRLHSGNLLSFQYQRDGQTLQHFVATTDGSDDLDVALQLFPSGSGLSVEPAQGGVPKLFVLFPLVGTERLGLPATVNSTRFSPREERDGILLGDSQGAQKNRSLLNKSVSQQQQLLDWCAEEKWEGAENLLCFDTSRLPDWVDAEGEWFRSLLSKLIGHARSRPLMLTLGGCWVAPQGAWLPTADTADQRARLWELMSVWKGADARLPRSDHRDSWFRNLANWAPLLGKERSGMAEAFTTRSVAKLVSETGGLERLQERLVEGESLAWLHKVLQLVCDAGDIALFDEYDLLPSQAGHLRRRSELRLGKCIAEDLKDIAESFGLEVRNELLHAGVNITGVERRLGSETEQNLVDRVVTRAHDKCADGVVGAADAPGVVRLFWWLASRTKYMKKLEGYPAPTAYHGSDGTAVLPLKAEEDGARRPLAPPAVWPADAAHFASLFPKRKVLSDSFGERRPDEWRALEKGGYVNTSPLLETKRGLRAEDFLPYDAIDDPASHRSTEDVHVSHVAFLRAPDTGLIDTARKSKSRAKEFLRFLMEFVIPTDDSAFEESSVACECGQEHKTYRGGWIGPLHNRRWVPGDSSGGGGKRASAESLANLLADSPDLVEALCSERGVGLMDALGISRAYLALGVAAPDEGTRVALIHSIQDLTAAAAGDVDRVRELVIEIREHPELIESIEEQKARRKKILRNQTIGQIVEDLLRRELQDRGLTVRRTGRGSDFEVGQIEVENDHVEDGVQVWFELMDGDASTFFIEVKSTTIDQVKMTPVQVEEACRLENRFALCVVPLEDDEPTGQTIRKQLRVVFGIGEYLENPFEDYMFWQEAAEDVRRHRGAIETEIVGGQVRFGIGRSIWGDALTFEEAIVRFQRGH